MKQWVKDQLKQFGETGICPACDFKVGGIFRVHNVHSECELMNNVKISEFFNKPDQTGLPIKEDE